MKKKSWLANRYIYYKTSRFLQGLAELAVGMLLLMLIARSFVNSGAPADAWMIATAMLKSLVPLVFVKYGAVLVYRSFVISNAAINTDRFYIMADSGDYINLKRSLKATKYFFINTPDRTMNTLLHYVAERGGTDMASFLIKKDANVNTRNSEGKTPLILAAQHGHLEIAKLLLKNGATSDIRTVSRVHVGSACMHQDEMSALDYAVRNSDTEMIALLKENN